MRRLPRSPSSALRAAALLVAALLTLGAAPAGDAPARGGSGHPGFSLGGRPCEPIAVPAATPVGLAGPCSGVRPGGALQTDTGLCTLNFVFAGSDGRRYVGTAGHCVLRSAGGEQAWRPGTGPVARDATGRRIGEFAYAVFGGEKDFALIRVDRGVRTSGRMCHFGGPTGVNTDRVSGRLLTLNFYGRGVGVGSVAPARSAYAYGMPDPDHVYAVGVAVPGDSGAAVVSSDGRAVGVLVTVGVHSATVGTSAVDAGTVGVTRLLPQLRRAGQVLRLSLRLVTAARG